MDTIHRCIGCYNITEHETTSDQRYIDFLLINLFISCPPPPPDDTYMYDDAARGHWYDEPPYESDPDDFLMTGIGLDPAAATIQVRPIRDQIYGPARICSRVTSIFWT